MEETTVFSVQEAYNLGYEDGFKTASTHTTQTRYVKERTCKLEQEFIHPSTVHLVMEYTCSSCGKQAYNQVLEDGDMPRYCPNCGARVVEVDE